ncbi:MULTISPECIES: hypothetical protein [unclassified Microbacterium]|uniref:hypothetical protein n=1 Tax=unclassified Microbacterium TaxID=2609290 RepID=UPI000EAA586D|nr:MULTISPECIES: hypothetical protein [unclassified Microbacterium]MBT2484770.1 hypothetical protein [Microbacterium sp. ISL-108]RKN67646.1 hypothetical protein D7252_08660 [Microbacterium sp. CGR2]
MTGVLILASFTVGLMALGQAALGAIMRLPFSGIHAVTYWTLVALFVLFGVLAFISHHNGPTPGAFA